MGTFREDLCEESGHESLLFLDPPLLDECVIGVTQDGRVVYDADKIPESLQKADGGTLEECQEFAEFNIFSSNLGPQTPVYVHLLGTLKL